MLVLPLDCLQNGPFFLCSGADVKVVLAPNALKGSLSSSDCASAMAVGVRRVVPDAVCIELPMADGGDGMRDAFMALDGFELCEIVVEGPLGDSVTAPFLLDSENATAVIEMADASGLALLDPARLDPVNASTVGVGQLMVAALDAGAERIVLGIGGSATNDAATGLATALGVRFLDGAGQLLKGCGGSLTQVASIDLSGLDPRMTDLSLDIVCDVDNPFIGPEGAAALYGPQKGADAATVQVLDAGMAHFAEVLKEVTGVDVCEMPGAGAAGGMGGGLHALFGARLLPGAELMAEVVGLDTALEGADLVITAEGRIDGQTAHGKAPAEVAKRAKAAGVPCVAIAGSLGDGYQQLADVGIDACFSLCAGPISLEEAMAQASELMSDTTEQAVRLFIASKLY